MKCKELFKEIDNLSSEYIKVFADVCNIESPTDYKAGVDEVGNYFVSLANRYGFTVERFPQEKAGDVICITMNPESTLAPVCFSGHMDTVHPVGLFGTPAVKIDGDKIYGPGVMDCKGGVVAGFLAMAALKNIGFTKRPVRLLLQSDEEVSSKDSNKATINYIIDRSRDAVAFLNLEGYEDAFEGKACLIRKGIVGLRFTITGIETHASYCAKRGASAILDAAHKIMEIEQFKQSDGITCNCGKIIGGTARNTVPGKCEFLVDVRYCDMQQRDYIMEKLQNIANTVHIEGCKCELEQISYRYPMMLNERNEKLLQNVNEIFKENGLSVLEIGARTGGSDAADVTMAGIPCMDSIGVNGDFAHSVNEWASIPSLMESAKQLGAIAYCME